MNSNNRMRTTGILRAIAHRPLDGQPLTEIQQAHVIPGRGLDTENRKPGKREITFLSAEAWAQTCAELGVVLPWYARRANLLVEGLDLASTIGRTLIVGPIRVAIHGETKPCNLMDQQHSGLRQALSPYHRGGVYGQVLIGGMIHVGDAVRLDDGV